VSSDDFKDGQLRFALDEGLFIFGDLELTPPVHQKMLPDSPVILLEFVPFYYVWKVLTTHGVGYVAVTELRGHSSVQW